MTDAFGGWIPDEFLDKMFAVAALTPHILYLFLTKRSDRLPRYFSDLSYRQEVIGISAEYMSGLDRHYDGPGTTPGYGVTWRLPFRNVMLGVSVENQANADARREHLREVAQKGFRTFVSYEPALAPVDWKGWEFLDWAIFGGESGAGARPCNVEWGRSSVRQWRASGVLAFVKQLGALPVIGPEENLHAWPGHVIRDVWSGGDKVRLRDSKGGDIEEWEPGLRVREFPKVAA